MAFAWRPSALTGRVTWTTSSPLRQPDPSRGRRHRIRFLAATPSTAESFKTEAVEEATPAAKAIPSGALVLVAGATGGVGQLTVQRLLESGFRVRAVARDLAKAHQLFGDDTPNLEVQSSLEEHVPKRTSLQIVKCDMRIAEAIPAVVEGVDAVCSCVGTTAFPSPRWRGDNNPAQTDNVAIRNLIQQTPPDVGRFVLISSAGVTRTAQFPFVVLNLFKVLSYRRGAEQQIMASNLPWTILRPSRLTDAPYTSTDLNSLIRGTRGDRLAVRLSAEDDLFGEVSRIAVAEAIVQCLHVPWTTHRCYALESVEGEDPPEQDTNKWTQLFSSCA